MKILLSVMLFLVLNINADVRKISIPAGKIANNLDSFSIDFYPYSISKPAEVYSFEAWKIIKKRKTGGEWYEITRLEPGVPPEREIIAYVPQHLAGKELIVMMNNPLAYESFAKDYYLPGYNSRAFFSPQYMFWRTVADQNGKIYIAHWKDTSLPADGIPEHCELGFDETGAVYNPAPALATSPPTLWNAMDAPTANTYPFWSYIPMKIASQDVIVPPSGPISRYNCTASQLPGVPDDFDIDNYWDEWGYSDYLTVPFWVDRGGAHYSVPVHFWVAERNVVRGIDSKENRGFQLKFLSRNRGYADYGVIDMIIEAPRPKGLVRWTKIELLHGIFGAGKFDGEDIYYTRGNDLTLEQFVSPLNDAACLFPRIFSGEYFTPSDECLIFDPVYENTAPDPVFAAKYIFRDGTTAGLPSGNAVYLNQRDPDTGFHNNTTEVKQVNRGYVPGLLQKTSVSIGSVPDTNSGNPPVRFWFASFNNPKQAMEALENIQGTFEASTLSSFGFSPGDRSGINAWERDLLLNNEKDTFGKYLVLRIILYTNPDIPSRKPNPEWSIFDTTDFNSDGDTGVYPLPPDSATFHSGSRNDGTMTPRLTGLNLEYVEYNPVIRLKNIQPATANDGSVYDEWVPQVWGFGKDEYWDFRASEWEMGVPTSEVYIRHEE